jgi:predicted Fe-Mo cluster-binding NifX family protein
MKIAVSATEGTATSQVEPRFGRSRWFVLFDSETGKHQVIDNAESADSTSGAGVSTAQKIVDSGAECVVTGRVGPNAGRVLEHAGVRVVDGVTGTVQEAADKAARGEL